MDSLYVEEFDAFIRWHRIGSGKSPVLYLPGLNVPATWTFLDVATHPSLDGTTGFLLDYFGSGDSDPSPWFPGTLDAQVQVIARVIDSVGCGACTVVGHSMGGSVAIALAAARPDLVARLVVAEANLTPGGGKASARIARQSRRDFVNNGLTQLLDRLRAAALAGDRGASVTYGAWRRAEPRALHNNARALVNLPTGFAATFLDLPMPRAFVYGAHTVPTVPAAATADAPDPGWLRQHGVTTVVVPGVGHALMVEAPVAFIAALAEAGMPLD